MQKLTLAHSPDADDAFMFYGLATGRVASGELRFDHQLSDIETLNRRAMDYALLRVGSSFGEGYGPLLVAREGMSAEDLAGKQVAVPGMLTSAYLLLKLFAPQAETVPVPFDQIPDAILERKTDAGVLIHEGQLTYGDIGLRAVVDLGRWWQQETGLPVPLGGLAVRRECGACAADFRSHQGQHPLRPRAPQRCPGVRPPVRAWPDHRARRQVRGNVRE
jgi:1,4-dihydroxy-6-naphthoate synthase